MYGIFTYIYPKNGTNVGKYTIHRAYGVEFIRRRSGRGYSWSPFHGRLGLRQLFVAAAETGRRPSGRPRPHAGSDVESGSGAVSLRSGCGREGNCGTTEGNLDSMGDLQDPLMWRYVSTIALIFRPYICYPLVNSHIIDPPFLMGKSTN